MIKRTEVKICGLTRVQDMRVCSDLCVKWTGFVFYPPSPRFVTLEQVQRLDQSVPPSKEGGPLRVGLFVKPTFSMLESVMSTVFLDVLQLYVGFNQLTLLCQHIKKPVWLAQGVHSASDLPTQAHFLAGYVIEAPAKNNDTRPGGLGRSFDWSLTCHWKAPTPWLLAGGLTPENVQEAIQRSGASAVDVSSGVEREPGVKCPYLIEKFVKKSNRKGLHSLLNLLASPHS